MSFNEENSGSEDAEKSASASSPQDDAESSTSPGDAGRGDPKSARTELRRLGDYELFEELGRGGMGVVYRARQIRLNRVVAVKTILAGAVANPETVRRFREEAEALARLRHPHIVAIHEIAEIEGQHLFSMEFVAGPSLAQALLPTGSRGVASTGAVDENRQANGNGDGNRGDHAETDVSLASGSRSVGALGPPWTPARSAELMRKVALAIHHAHEQGLLHRDIKPSNILLDPEGEPRVTDFGCAKRLGAEADVTYTGHIVGSPQYFAPEQFSPARGAVGVRTDVFGLGAVLYHLLTGRPPRHGATLEAVMLCVLDGTFIPPRELKPELPRDLETICLKCLELEPDQRYGSAREFADELTRFLAGEPIQARPIGPLRRCWRRARRRPGQAVLGGTVLLALVALATALGLIFARPRSGSTTAAQAQTRAPIVTLTLGDTNFPGTNWSLHVAAPAPGAGASASNATTQVAGQNRFTNTLSPWGYLRTITNQLAAGAHVIGFHLYTNETFNPSISGALSSLDWQVDAQQINGVTGTQVGPCLEQNDRFYLVTPATMDAGNVRSREFRTLRDRDFVRYDGLTPRSREHPDFSARGGVIRFGFAVLDTDTQQGHSSWSVVDNFQVAAFGPGPGEFPVNDGDFYDVDWTMVSRVRGRAEATSERARGGHPGWCRQVAFKLSAPSNIDTVLLSQRAYFAPVSQGALAEVSVSLEILETSDSPGLQKNPNLVLALAQSGRIYVTRQARPAAFSGVNGGWEKIMLARLNASDFSEYLAFDQWGASPDFSTNGRPIHFGFMIRHTTAYRHDTNGFATSSRFDNFSVEVRTSP